MLIEYLGGPNDGARRIYAPNQPTVDYYYQAVSPEHQLKYTYRIKRVGGTFKAVVEGCTQIGRRET